MNNSRYLAIIFIFTLIIASCKTDQKKQQIKAIGNLEQELYKTTMLDREQGMHMIDTYLNYSKQYPEDTLSANYLYKAAEIAMNLELGTQSLFYFDKIINNYPDYHMVPECLFMKAFIYDTRLNNLVEAEQLYKTFIEKYPNHPLAKDAQASINYLGKSPEELVRMFEEMNKDAE